MFQRNIIHQLNAWKTSLNRKPLVLRGARQVGKTTVVNQFAANFIQYIYLNLEDPDDRYLFKPGTGIDALIDAIFFYKSKSKPVEDTLIFIDEIQQEPNAISLLRFFYEKYKQYYVIAAGSLLETVLDKNISFPVGRVEYLYMYPLSFVEFLGALDEEPSLEQYFNYPVNDFAHEKLLKLFHLYTLIGGMPEVVKVYAEQRDLTSLYKIYESLLIAYIDDIEKYARNSTLTQVMRHAASNCFNEAGSRIKFNGFANSSYASREMGEALRTLEKARLLYLVYPTTNYLLPFSPDVKKMPRLQVLDTGLMNYFSGIQQQVFGSDSLMDVYKGKVVEHIVGQELIVNNSNLLQNLLFWVRDKKDSSAELDYVFRYQHMGIPIEIKAGKTGKLKSLFQFLDLSKIPLAIRLYSGNYSRENHITPNGNKFVLLNIPYYLAGNIHVYIEREFD